MSKLRLFILLGLAFLVEAILLISGRHFVIVPVVLLFYFVLDHSGRHMPAVFISIAVGYDLLFAPLLGSFMVPLLLISLMGHLLLRNVGVETSRISHSGLFAAVATLLYLYTVQCMLSLYAFVFGTGFTYWNFFDIRTLMMTLAVTIIVLCATISFVRFSFVRKRRFYGHF